MTAIMTLDFNRVNVPLRWNASAGFVYANEGANTLVYATGLDWDVFSWATPFVEFSGEFRVEDNGMPIDIMEDPMLLTPGLRLHLPWNIELSGGIDFSVRMLRNRYDRDKEMSNVGAYTIGYTDEKGVPVFEVQDTGIGIAPEDLPKVFERFYRADDARNRKTGGTGLGLSIAKWIVDRHGGHFDIKSYPDAGTRFSVFLPVKKTNDK